MMRDSELTIHVDRSVQLRHASVGECESERYNRLVVLWSTDDQLLQAHGRDRRRPSVR
jgi:hypothetical protein